MNERICIRIKNKNKNFAMNIIPTWYIVEINVILLLFFYTLFLQAEENHYWINFGCDTK